MYEALPKIGLKPYHCNATTREHPTHLHMWIEALKLKYGPGTQLNDLPVPSSGPYTPADFARYYKSWGYTAITDQPSVLFAPELMAAFPNARIVLSQHPRGVEGWVNSMTISILPLTSWRVWDYFLVPFDTYFCRQYIPMLRRNLEIWTLETPWPGPIDVATARESLRKYHEKHYEEVRNLAKEQGREVLEFNPAMGWEPLCKFLGKPVPSEPYPFINEAKSLVDLHHWVVRIRVLAVLGKWLPFLGAAAAIGVGVWYARG